MVITSILLNGCASMQTHWESAKTENTVEAYTKFLKDYPNSPYYKEAVSDFINLLITSKHSDYHWNSEPGKTLLWLGADAVDELMNVLYPVMR